MSPDEPQLRHALRDGEGEPVDAAALIAHARTVRRARRVRLASVATAVVAVAAVGIGSAFVFGNRASTPAAEHSQSGGPRPTGAPMPHPTATGATPHATPNSATQASCPTAVPHLLPGGGGRSGTGGPLFDGPVASVEVCGYAASSVGAAAPLVDGTVFVHGTVLIEPQSSELVASLEAASTVASKVICVRFPSPDLVITGIAADGTRMPPVVASRGPCGTATNGAAIRYDWNPPVDLANQLSALTIQTSMLPSHRASGSPVH